MYDQLEDDQIKKAQGYVRLYSTINKARTLGLSFDSSNISARELDGIYILESAMTEVQAARRKGKK